MLCNTNKYAVLLQIKRFKVLVGATQQQLSDTCRPFRNCNNREFVENIKFNWHRENKHIPK